MSVEINDLVVPPAPEDPAVSLLTYLGGPYAARRARLRELISEAKSFKDKTTVITLGYEALLFRSEVDTWVAFCGQLLDAARGEQLSVAHGSQNQDGKKLSTEYLKAQAGIFIAPLKQAHTELKDTQDLLNKTISFCQSQQKAMAADEYGDIFSANNTPPPELFSDAPQPKL